MRVQVVADIEATVDRTADVICVDVTQMRALVAVAWVKNNAVRINRDVVPVVAAVPPKMSPLMLYTDFDTVVPHPGHDADWVALLEPVRERHVDHCDRYIHNPSKPVVLRWFLLWHRLPAADRDVMVQAAIPAPVLYADHAGARVRVTMASRLGDVGITADLASEHYQTRVGLRELSGFSRHP